MGQDRSFLLGLSFVSALSLLATQVRSAHAQEASGDAPSSSEAPPAAATPSEPSSADRVTARQLAEEGYHALKAKEYETARDRFSRALALVRAPTLLRDLARSQVGLGKLVDAHESYNTIVREGVAPGSPTSWTKALADAKTELAALTPRIPSITITVDGPGSPRVTIDGAPIPPESLGIKRPIDPGRHEVRALGSGYYTAKKTVRVKEGEELNVAFELEEAPPDATPTVLEEERNSGVVVTFAEPAWRKPTMIAAFAVGGAGLALGSVTGVLALSKHGKLSTDCARNVCGPQQKSDLDTYHTLGQLSTIGFVVAGVGAAAGTVLLFMRPQPQDEDAATDAAQRPQRERGAQISPYVGLGSVGVGGTF